MLLTMGILTRQTKIIAKIIHKIIKLLKYRIYKKARRNKPKEQSNFIVLLIKLTGLAFVEFVVVSCCLVALGKKRTK
jgi:hypothetical protein